MAHRFVEQWSASHPNSPALQFYSLPSSSFSSSSPLDSCAVALSYSQLNVCANIVAHHIRNVVDSLPSSAVPSLSSSSSSSSSISFSSSSAPLSEYSVALHLEDGPHLIPLFLGILKAGGCVVPLDLASPKSRLCHILNETKCILLIVDRKTLEGDRQMIEDRNMAVKLVRWEEIFEETEEEEEEEWGPLGLVHLSFSLILISLFMSVLSLFRFSSLALCLCHAR